jgi:hypothetical protein
VIDITNPQSPQIVGNVIPPHSVYDIAVSGTYAYVAAGPAVAIIDITNPQSPQIVGSAYVSGDVSGVVTSGGRFYVSNYDSGFMSLPLQCPATPVFLTSFTLSGSHEQVEVRWAIRSGESDGAFRLRGSSGEARWDVPVDAQSGTSFVAIDRSPRLAEGGEVLYELWYRGPEGNWLVLAQQSIDLGTSAGPMRLLGPYPNPAFARVVIPYSAGHAGRARLTVHDVAGREVAHVFEGRVQPGVGQWIWSGENSRGGKLAAGMYLIRLTTDRGKQTRKVVLVESSSR